MKKYLISTFLFCVPIITHAQEIKTFQEIVADLIVTGSNYLLRLLVALTLFVFLFGLMKYMYKGQESDQARSEGRKLMLWGIVGLFVMTSVWALVAILSNLIGHDKTTIPQFRESTESDIAPFGRFGTEDGTQGVPLTKEQYEAGQKARRAIDSTLDQTAQTAQDFKGRVKSAAKSSASYFNSLLKSVNNYLKVGQ